MNIKTFVLSRYQSNCYVLYNDFEAMIIDPGDQSDKLNTFLADKGLVVKVIYITHGHIDHVGGVNALKRRFPNCIVYAPLKDHFWYAKNPKFGLTEDVLIDVYVKEGDIVLFQDQTYEVMETPGHSYGSTCLLYKKTLFSGDTLFKGSIGRTDLYLGNFEEIKASIQNKLYRLPNHTLVYPGHGEPTTIEFEKKHNPFVKGITL